jgi:phosphodiesterase/alkaline phosphatase D-like protein
VAAAAAVAVLTPGSALAAKGFTGGVTAGEITDHSAIIWARTKSPGPVSAQVTPVKSSGRTVSIGILGLRASKGKNDTVQTKVGSLKSNVKYRYRFCLNGHTHGCSAKGTFETAPKPSAKKTIRFAWSGDETGVSAPGQHKPFWGRFKAFKSMAAEHNDFNIDFGDVIYSDPEVPGAAVAHTVKQKWAMYRKKLAVANMRKIRASTGLYNHWDDHEFINDFSIAENGRKLYNRSVKAFRDYEPVTFTKKRGIYRTFRWGKNLQLFFLDERSFRSAKASANGVCDNPDTGEPDLAPTAPPASRALFSALIPSLAQPVSQACKDAINSPSRTFLGKPQLQRFLHAVEHSKAKWKVVMNEDPIQQFYGLPFDRWEGYAHERLQLLNALQSHDVNHLVFLTTDTHAAFANVVRERTLANDVAPANAPMTAPSDTPYQDFIIGPVATKPFWQEIDDATGGTGNGELLSQVFFKAQPTGPAPNGPGMACAQGGENSYGEVTVKNGTLKVAYKDENGTTVKDVDGTTPCGPYTLTH